MEDKINDFFQRIKLCKVSEKERKICDVDITSEEDEEVIGTLASGKACGSDGFPAEIYKSFKRYSCPLTRMLKHSLSIKKLPQSVQQATIQVILKENKDPDDPAPCRPMSNQNTDCMILAKLFVSRLNHIPKTVEHNQNGFVQNRQSYSNIRRVLDILQYVKIKKLNTLVITLDAE